MAIVSGRPDHLHRYADALMAPDAELRDEVATLRAVLRLYLTANPDFGRDHSALADELEVVLVEAMELNAQVRLTASAFEALDEAPSSVLRSGSEGDFEQTRAHIAEAWDEVDSLLDLVVDLGERKWFDLVLGGWRCAPGPGRYGGSGGLRGPDGRIYPLVIPELEIDGRVAHVAYGAPPGRDPATLGGADDGWQVTDERVGVARVEDYEPTAWARGLVTVAMATGLQGPSHRTASRTELQAIGFSSDGRPVMGEAPGRPVHDPRPLHGSQEPERPRPWLGHRSRPARVGGTLDLVVGALDGARVASELENPGTNLYRVLFEEHEDGARRRARLHTYQLLSTAEGSSFVPFMGYGVGGRLRRRQVTPAPQGRHVLSPGPGSGARGAAPRTGHGPPGRRREETRR